MTTKKTKHIYINQCIGLVLREFRKCKGLSGVELAKVVGLSQQQISRYESGKNQVTLYMLFEILMALDVSIEKFILELKKIYMTELDNFVINPEVIKNKIVSLF
ncbi:helix-turn-helix domain-containing protein [Providencia burhodogranariea]|uniref:Transcriptional regulator MutR n=1 Tax=Providencia burhodogranariea DSM 19968 TaxID=1141662 RepID=K8X4M0_9GAMM|nr:helix-turn-helix transcriptional regulator [Providencia burhodogranariea]EKT64627.1 transcriptional regulator MutR [Providencia burhodogranariea DSM 19968]